MAAPSWSQADFLAAFQGLMPRGPIWPREPDAVQTQTLNALMPTYVRQFEDSVALLIDCFPATAVQLLPEWEATLGLPDNCTPLNATIPQRQAAVVAQLIATGGQSIPYFIAVALALGYVITVQEFWAATAGMPCGLPDYGPAWNFAWQVNCPSVIVTHAVAGASVAGDPLTAWASGAELVCRLNKLSPAQTQLIFAFTQG